VTVKGSVDPLRLLFLTRSLTYGGSERQLVALAKGLWRQGVSVTVATFYPGGPLGRDIESTGVSIESLEKRARWDVLGFFWRLLRLVRRIQPTILHGYLATANILTVLLKPFFPSAKIVWGLRASNMELERYGYVDQIQSWVECKLSHFADLIVVNSHAGFDFAARKGFPQDKMVVIPNGIDTERFVPDRLLRDKLRTEWGVGPTETLIGLVARLDPMKDHPTFLRAAAFFARECPHVRFVCVGDGAASYREQLQALSRELGLAESLRWVGFRDDIAAVYNSLDLACSSSLFGEGFSNAIAEAMACGVPCVVTDVGDSAAIVGATGEVVPGGDPQALANGWRRLRARLRVQPDLRAEARNRIAQHFGVASLVERTSAALHSVLP